MFERRFVLILCLAYHSVLHIALALKQKSKCALRTFEYLCRIIHSNSFFRSISDSGERNNSDDTFNHFMAYFVSGYSAPSS